MPATLEGKIVRLSDKIAYIHHDMDDAMRGNILTEQDVPKEICEVIGYTTRDRLDHFIHDIVTNSANKSDIQMSVEVSLALGKLRKFMFERVYTNKDAKSEEKKAEVLMETLFEYYRKHIELLPPDLVRLMEERGESREQIVCDYLASMTDRFAIAQYEEIYIPKSWQ